MTPFEIFWIICPKYAQRSKRAISEAIFNAITGPGRTVRVDGLTLHHQTTPDVLIRAMKAYSMALITASNDENPDGGGDQPFKYVPGVQVWLNQGRWEDMDDDEIETLCNRYDDMQERLQAFKDKQKLRVIK